MPIKRADRDTSDAGSGDTTGAVLSWFAAHARDLPWRAADRSPWGVLVSEVMLQQTGVGRVEPKWRGWMQRWPEPADLAAAPLADVLLEWQGLGYPRRAVRLHRAAAAIEHCHGGRVPAEPEQLRALPGIGEYTAAAVAAFAFGRRVAVLDTNVRRVLIRWLGGEEHPASAGITAAERARAEAMLPGADVAALWSVAVMELGALVCTSRAPRCGACPLAADCAWLAAGRPAGTAPRRQGRFEGSDRQARGHLLRAVGAAGSVDRAALVGSWERRRAGAAGAAGQAERALQSLVDDGLLEDGRGHARDRFSLPQ